MFAQLNTEKNLPQSLPSPVGISTEPDKWVSQTFDWWVLEKCPRLWFPGPSKQWDPHSVESVQGSFKEAGTSLGTLTFRKPFGYCDEVASSGFSTFCSLQAGQIPSVYVLSIAPPNPWNIPEDKLPGDHRTSISLMWTWVGVNWPDTDSNFESIWVNLVTALQLCSLSVN